MKPGTIITLSTLSREPVNIWIYMSVCSIYGGPIFI